MELRDRHQAGEVYTIRQVSEMTGVPENTIRSWERRFGIPSPARSGSNQRRYTEQDALAIRSIQASRDRGRTMEQAILDLGSPERPAPEPGPLPEAPPPAERRPPPHHHTEMADPTLIAALTAFDGGRANEIIAERLWNSSIESACIDVLLPALLAIDERLAEGRLPQVQARFGKAWIRRKLQAALNDSSPEQGRLSILVASMQDDSAGDDGVCLSIILSRAGYRVLWVGSGSTVADIDLAVTSWSPHAAVLATRSPLSIAAARSAADHVAGARGQGAWQGLIAVAGSAPEAGNAINLPLHATQTVTTLERALHAHESPLRIVRHQ